MHNNVQPIYSLSKSTDLRSYESGEGPLPTDLRYRALGCRHDDGFWYVACFVGIYLLVCYIIRSSIPVN